MQNCTENMSMDFLGCTDYIYILGLAIYYKDVFLQQIYFFKLKVYIERDSSIFRNGT